MAADGTALLRDGAFAFSFTMDGAITTVVAEDTVEEELARRRGRDASKKNDSDPAKKTDGDAAAKKRGRDGGVDQGEESDAARGWSSAVVDRGLALRRRGGSAFCCRPRCGLIVGEEAAVSRALGVGAEAEAVETEVPLVDPTLVLFYSPLVDLAVL